MNLEIEAVMHGVKDLVYWYSVKWFFKMALRGKSLYMYNVTHVHLVVENHA